MRGAVCVLCEAPAVHAHHVTGRLASDETYLDRLLVVDLCQRCHIAEHQALRRLGLDWPARGDDLIAHRLVRLGAFANRTADLDRGLVLDACSTRGLSALLLDAHASLTREAAS